MFAKQLTEGRQQLFRLSRPVKVRGFDYDEERDEFKVEDSSRYVVVSRSCVDAELYSPVEFMVFLATPEGAIKAFSEAGVSYTSHRDALRGLGATTFAPLG